MALNIVDRVIFVRPMFYLLVGLGILLTASPARVLRACAIALRRLWGNVR
jgi:hypothetical protein